jgi:signal transduction histidine kinase
MSQSRPRVLCVDDEPHVLAALSDGLRRRFEVVTAQGGGPGLQALANQGPFTVVVSDYMMPGMNGGEFLAYARVAAPDTVRLLLTGQTDMHTAIDAVNEGNIFRLLNKPCAIPDLIVVLDAAVEQYRLVTADRALVERKVEQMSGQLLRAERLASLGTLAGAVGHELRNVLLGFGGAIELIEQQAARGLPASREDLDILKRSQERLSAHASNLLRLGRPATAETEAPSTDLKEAVKQVLATLGAAGLLRDTRVDLTVPRGPTVVALGAIQIEQVLLNLIKNALEALAERRVRDPFIQIEIPEVQSAAVTCRITDNGGGIAAERLPLLFEPYFTTKPPELGTGLGLFVVREILRNAGGDIAVESRGGGTSFTATMLLASPSLVGQ